MICRLLPVFICLHLSNLIFSQHTRIYKESERYRYRLTTESFRNNQPDAKSIAVSQHTIIKDSGQWAEEIKWLSKITCTKTDTLFYDSLAQRVPSYLISLAAGNKVALPPLTIPEMTGEITDLNTFYVAVSPALHSQLLTRKLRFFTDSILHGNFADGKQILKGEDCIQVTQTLVKRNNRTIVIRTSFLPLGQRCIDPYTDTVGKQLFNTPNNFQMIRKSAGDRVNLFWGVEQFVITSTIERRTGLLLKADMVNLLELRMRVNATADLKNYDAEIPLTIRRELRLELLH